MIDLYYLQTRCEGQGSSPSGAHPHGAFWLVGVRSHMEGATESQGIPSGGSSPQMGTLPIHSDCAHGDKVERGFAASSEEEHNVERFV